MLVWLLFAVIVGVSFALDVGVCSRGKKREDDVLSIRAALVLSLLWIALAMAYNLFLYIFYDSKVRGNPYEAVENHTAPFSYPSRSFRPSGLLVAVLVPVIRSLV